MCGNSGAACGIAEAAGSPASADAEGIDTIVGPQAVIAWQQTGAEELHGCCPSVLNGESATPS